MQLAPQMVMVEAMATQRAMRTQLVVQPLQQAMGLQRLVLEWGEQLVPLTALAAPQSASRMEQVKQVSVKERAPWTEGPHQAPLLHAS